MRILFKLFTYRKLCHIRLLKVIAGIIIFFYVVTATMSHTFAIEGPAPSEDSTRDIQPVASQEKSPDQETLASVAEADETKKQRELKHRQYKLTLLVIIVGVIGLFMVILLITIIRIGRFRHRRLGLGRKSPPTEYIDAWSHYRLEDDEKK
jgi:Na+-transporting methylmalonyl-CoA/oxaloacetate decarboxylase gamma subunit